jgi:lysozyme family protein
MADFSQALEKTLSNEGGYTYTNVPNDPGGPTYAGIARNYHKDWPGWTLVDAGKLKDPALIHAVSEFYRAEFWNRVHGDVLTTQFVAESVFDFAVNAGVPIAIKLAQAAVGAGVDGVIGPKTTALLNQIEADEFALRYCLAKVRFYVQICNNNPNRRGFLLGWINRALKGVA